MRSEPFTIQLSFDPTVGQAAFFTATGLAAATVTTAVAASSAVTTVALTALATLTVTLGALGIASMTAYGDESSVDAGAYFQNFKKHAKFAMPAMYQAVAQVFMQAVVEGVVTAIRDSIYNSFMEKKR